MEKQKPSVPRSLPRVTWQQILREFQARTAPTKPRSIKVGSSIQEIASQIRARQTPRFFGLIPEQAALLARFFPELQLLTVVQADAIKGHFFDVMGSGKKNLGKEIDWHTDFIHGYTWPVQHQLRMTMVNPSKPSDPRVPWELSRFYHAVRLGQAYLYTQDESYAQEIIDQISHWIKANPYGFGINWLDVKTAAIRVVNWIWAYYCILESKSLNEQFLAVWLASLKEHGEHLLKHLPKRKPHTNQYIAALAGLAYLGILFPEFTEAARWKSTAFPKFWDQLDFQVLPDGMSYEASLAYHRFITEMALSVAGLCVVNGIEIPEAAQGRMRAMLDVIMVLTQPDGLVPQIGDSNEERLHILSVYSQPTRTAADHRHLLALGSLILERELSEWAGYIEPTKHGWVVGAENEWQDAFWCFASDAAARFTDVLTRTIPRPATAPDDAWIDVRPGIRLRSRALARKPVVLDTIVGSRYFDSGGLYVMRHQDFHLTIDAGGVGQDGRGGHAHNDTLGITLVAYGKTFLIDPGTYQYETDPLERNRFRSTAYHNTLQVSKEEINRVPEGRLFGLTEDARVTVHHWVSQSGFDLFDASHTGYTRLKPGVFHRRQLWFDKVAKLWVMHDQVRALPGADAAADTEIDVSVWFHFAPMVVRVDKANNAIRTEETQGANLTIAPLGDFRLKAVVEDGWYSPQYGVKKRATIANFSGHVKLPADFVLMLYPHQIETDFQSVRTAGRAALVNFKRALAPLSTDKQIANVTSKTR